MQCSSVIVQYILHLRFQGAKHYSIFISVIEKRINQETVTVKLFLIIHSRV